MEQFVQAGTGWLVIDESGTITFWGGDMPKRLPIGRNGHSAHSLSELTESLGGPDLLESFHEVCAGTLEAAEGEMRARGKQKLNWSMRMLSASTGGRSVLLSLRHTSPAEQQSEPKESHGEAFQRSAIGMFRTSLSGRYLEVNAALANLCGYTSPEELMETLRDSRRPFYVKRHRRLEFVEQMRSQGAVEDFQAEIFRVDSQKVWITKFARTVRDSRDRPLYYEGTVLDITSYKAAESALRESREQFRRLLETANVVPWEGDIDGRIRYVGPQAELLLGFPMEEWLRPGFWNERICPDDREWVEIVRNEAIENLGRFESEYRMVNAAGEVVWVRDIVGMIEAAKGELILGGFLHDITHRRAAEESLRESQDFIEQIARASPLIWYVFDADTERMVYLNGGGIQTLGHSKEALLKMQPSFIESLAHPSELSEHGVHFKKLATVHRGELVEREFRLAAESGKWMWFRTHEAPLKTDENGRVRQFVGIAEDITFQQAALEDLANNEALYRRLAETTRVIPFELELNPVRFTYIGPQAEDLLGFPLRQWLTPGFWMSVVHPEDCAHVEATLAEAVNRRDAHVEVELRLCDSQGEIHWVRQIVRCEAAEGAHARCRGFFLDISETKKIEVEREESRRQLRQLALENQRVREEERLSLSREIHDELGQALTLFRLDLTWLGRRVSKALNVSEAEPLLIKVQEMEQQIAATLQTVRRIATQLRPPVLDEFGLAEAIEWQANEFSRRVGVRCEVLSQFTECSCKDTATMIFRIFQELLTNVARHSKASRVRVFLKQMGGIIYLSVHDNGCGFEVGAARRNTGFGLLGMRERAESVRGRLQIDSALGSGTTVTLCVPHSP